MDLTLPGAGRGLGSLHPITLVQMELEQIFQGMSFIIGTGFHVEREYYNFDALNIPGDHPAREMQDTFWLTNGMLLRTHTSANQVRMLEKHGAPLRAIFPGRCFRYENVDASHENTFYQLEGLMVDKGISIAHLIGVMKALLDQVFHRDVKVRLRPGYFPFVEPGFELDCQCLICCGQGCKTCKHSGWIELLALRHGAPAGAAVWRRGRHPVQRLRLWPGANPPGHDEVRHPRDPPAQQRRRALLEPVPG